MNETLMIIYMVLGGALFALGGGFRRTNRATYNNFFEKLFLQLTFGINWKGWRRFILPLVTFGFLLLNKVDLGMACVSAALLVGVLTLGYGVRKTWVYRTCVAFSYSVPSLVLGLTLWQLILPLLFILMFIGSNYLFQKDIPWKTWEFLMGVLIAVTTIAALNRPW